MAVNSFNAQNPPVTTKGDVFTFSTIPTRLGVGANNTVLTADSSTATGLKWAAVSASPASGVSTVNTSESTTSSTYTDLATVQSVTLTTGTKALVLLSAEVSPQGGSGMYVSVAVTGASSVSASDNNAIRGEASQLRMGVQVLLTGLTAGSNTFTMKFKRISGSGTPSALSRQIAVIDLGS